MTVTNVDANSTKNLGQLLVQQILAQGNGTAAASGDGSGASSPLSDQLTLSPAAQALSKAVPAKVTSAMQDLISGRKDVKADSAALKAYLQANPQGMAAVMATLNSSSGTYSSSGALSGNSALQQLLGNAGSTGNGAVGSLLQLFSGSDSSAGNTLLQILNGKPSTSAPGGSALQSLLGNSGSTQDPLLAALGGSSDGSSSDALFG